MWYDYCKIVQLIKHLNARYLIKLFNFLKLYWCSLASLKKKPGYGHIM